MTPRDENLALALEDDRIDPRVPDGWERSQMDYFFCDRYERLEAGPPTLADASWFYARTPEDDARDYEAHVRELRLAEEDLADQDRIARAS